MADISNITLPNGKNYDIKDKYTNVAYGTCTTAAATAAKVVTIADNPNWKLQTGSVIVVKFSYTNTASNPTLNVNSTGNKAIKYRGSNITAGYLAANRTYTFIYDGTNYDLVGDINTDTDTDTKVTQSATITANYRPILMGYNNSTDTSTLTTTVTDQAYASSSIYAQPSTGTLYASKYNGYKIEGTSGNWFSSFPVIRNDGVMEAGKYIDFHTTNTGTTDYDVRLTAGSGTLTCSGSIAATAFSGNASSATALTTSAGSATQPVYFSNGKPVKTTYTLGKSVPSNAVFTDTDTKVTSAAVNPSSATTYYPTLVTGATTGTVSYNTDLNAAILQGTTSTEGYAVLTLGNNTAKGTAGNKKGQINLYSPSTSYSRILQEGITSPVSHIFPTTGGTVLNSGTTSFTPSITSGSRSGVLKINNNSYNIYFTDTKVTQTNTTTSGAYRLLMSGNANDTTQTVTTHKSSKFTANPSTGCLTASMFKGAYSTVYSGTISRSSGTITISNLWNYSLLFLSIYNIDATLAQVDRYPIAVQKLYAGNSEAIYIFTANGALSTSKFLTFKKSSTANSIDITTSGIKKIGQITIEAFL